MFLYRPPPVLVPRLLRLTADERADQEGNARSPLGEGRCLLPPNEVPRRWS